MKKYIIMALVSSFMGIMSNPEVLTASDRVALNGLSSAGIVETIEVATGANADVDAGALVADGNTGVSGGFVSANTVSGVMYNSNTSGDVVGNVSYAPVTYVPANNIQIAGHTIEVVVGGSGDSGSHVNMNGRLLAGHNSVGVFGGLSGVGVGTTFSVTVGGVTTNYRVSNKVTYTKDDLNKQVSYVCGYGTRICNGNLMSQLKDPTDTEMRHSLVLMTCAGTMLGGGDATHRLVLFADAI
ncbi:hypothetical protein IJG04_02675 [Candidatus Saccharibacteria bacterium]|nr:hypothetical protein [Candidatus Saccharibacteria bacterium]